MPAAARTKSGTRKLSEVARHVVKPTGITTTGWGPVAATCRDKLGVTFDEWQAGAGRIILAKRADGKLAAMVGGVGMSLPRQVGKTYLLAGLIFGLCVNKPGLLVIWSAHHARTHGETFLSMQAFAERSKVRPYVKQVFTGSGDEEIRFGNGSRILFGARERGFGRGVPGVDVLVMDEAQILSDKALENMLATLNTSDFGLQLYIGTPPRPEDNSEAFRRMRTEALSGESDDAAWIECGADPGCDPDDHKQWAKANPSYPHRTPVESIMRLRKKLKIDGFLHEGLGIWDEESDKSPSIFGTGRWESCAGEPEKMPASPAAIGVAVSVDRTWASIAAASMVEAIEDPDDPEAEPVDRLFVAAVDRREDVDWLVAEVSRIQRETECLVVIDEKGPTKDLLDDLLTADVSVESVSLDEYAEGCSRFFDKVRAGTLMHPSSAELDAAVSGAVWRTVGDRQVWGRRKSTRDVSMLEAATLAAYGADKFGAFNIY